MPEPKSVTFRDQTSGRISDLLGDEGKPCAHSQNLLTYLAGALLNYKDEGVELSPSIVLCDSIDAFLQAFPGAVTYRIGQVPLDPASGPQILKDCAPLSNRNWFIFIERNDNGIAHYGVFTYFRLPTAIPLHEGIAINPNEFSILIRKVSSTTIEMRGSKGSILSLIFSTIRESAVQGAPIELFAADCCRTIVPDEHNKGFQTYFVHLVEAALTSSHGTMLVCGQDLDLSKVAELQDAVPMSPTLDFHTAFSEYQAAGSAGAILSLQRNEELLSGLLRCDGMIVFDTAGCVTAYRVFFRPVGEAKAAAVVGGARRRAFEGVKGLVGKRLVSVLFRSQDGLTLYHGVEE